MVGIAHYYMQLNIVYSILLQKENILIFIFFASSTLLLTLVFFFFQTFSLSMEIDLFTLVLSGFFIIFIAKYSNGEVE